MAQNMYEVLFLLDPNKASADWDNTVATANGILEEHGAEILESGLWGEPKLAYQIENFRKGTYLLTYFHADGQSIEPMEKKFKLADPIVRHMIVKHHPKIAERILADIRAAQEEHYAQEEGEGDLQHAEGAGQPATA